MTQRARPRTTPGLALLLALAVAFAPALGSGLLTSKALGQGETNASSSPGGQASQDRAAGSNTSDEGGNESDHRDANQSGEDRRQANESQRDGDADGRDAGSDDRRRDGTDRGSDERGRAPPVQIRDRPGGFATRAPSDSPRPTVAVDARNASATVQRGDVTPMAVHMDTLVEFVDQDGDGAYDIGEPVVNHTDLQHTPHRVEVDQTSDSRSLVYDLGNESQLRLVYDLGTDQEDAQVAAKFDVRIDDYDFQHSDARIALGSHVEVVGGLERVEREGQPAVAGQQGEEVTYLSWVPTVDVDGEEHPVASSVHVDAEQPSESAIVYWAYPQGDEIVHDPTLGVQDAVQDLAGRVAPFALGLAGTLAVLGVGYEVRARWGP